MKWTVHGERSLYESDWVRLVLTDVEIPDGERSSTMSSGCLEKPRAPWCTTRIAVC
jgi:hypothetical protein